MTQPTLINFHPNEYSQELHYYPFAVKLDRCAESWNTLKDLSNKVCTPNKTGDLNQRMFNMITGISELKTSIKHISCESKCKFNGKKCNQDQWWNNDKCWCECKTSYVCKNYYVWNAAICSCENAKYLASIIDCWVIMCDKIIDVKAKSNGKETKTVPANFIEKTKLVKHKISIAWFHFY